VFGLIPALAILGLLGFYSFYLLYLGLPKLMQASADKGLGYTVVVIIVSIVLWIIVAAVGGAIGGAAMMGMGGASLTQPVAEGTVTTPVGSVDLGKLQKAADQMSKQAEAMKNGTAAPVKVADASAMAALMPASYMGAAAIDPSTSFCGAQRGYGGGGRRARQLAAGQAGRSQPAQIGEAGPGRRPDGAERDARHDL
jgi:hypothetical protein